MTTNKTNLTVYLREELLERLRHLAAVEGRSVSNYMERLVEQHFKKRRKFEKAS